MFFGASGDLTKRMLIPAMYNLRLGDVLPTSYGIVGFSRSEKSDDLFRDEMKTAIDTFSRSGEARDPLWSDFANRLTYVSGSFDDVEAYHRLRERLDSNDEQLGTAGKPALLSLDAAERLRDDRPAARSRGARPTRSRARLVAHHHRETVRHGSRIGAGVASRRQQSVRRATRLPDRPLPRQRARARHHGVTIRERHVRADSGTAATSTACRSPQPKPSASRDAADTTNRRARSRT